MPVIEDVGRKFASVGENRTVIFIAPCREGLYAHTTVYELPAVVRKFLQAGMNALFAFNETFPTVFVTTVRFLLCR